MWNIVNLAILLCFFGRSVGHLDCYPDYCQNSTILTPIPGFQCLLTKVQKGEDCTKLTFENSHHKASNPDSDKITLRAYTYKEYITEKSEVKVTAFNLSLANASFHGLITRYQNLLNPNESACRHIVLYGNETHPAPKDLYVSCPFSNNSFESFPYQLDILVISETYNYSKRYIFNVPRQKFTGEGVSVKAYTPFVYIDVSYAPLLSLHIQGLPESFNVSEYKVWLINRNTDTVEYKNVLSTTSNQHLTFGYNFTALTGEFYFNVSAIHPDCGDNGCVNTTTPLIIIPETTDRLLIMIISTVWIPPVMLYVLYHLYKLYRKEGSKRRRKPTCLLIYSPTRLTHINAMNELAKYLRNSNVTVIDMLGITDATGKDLRDCWNAAFPSADVVLVAASPPPKKPTVSFIYRDNDNDLLKLVRENQCQRDKRYYIVQLPYCKPEDMPEETRHMTRFCLPKELPKLVKVIHKMERVGSISVSDKEFLDSVKLAKLEILEEDANSTREARETENLLTSESERMPEKHRPISIATKGNVVSQTFATNINELNLLGENEPDGDATFTAKSLLKNTGSFCIDELNL
ncbi:PREDICTED: uncharacterized protein LOC107189611 [Dufourea novaeangliae]|uniref:SEFIR domain-containing protein n=1 Tax=Dufourea novaeangliae TaxID=178035 RepID=A0A154PJY8_DUFNO|nr:PREDICTED: uncharacterized protein LOC107189611 [Dufourea novaeangliae]KZC11530.1 hypothetical protein WN55_03090 [Dufourea novaeangliae]